MGKSQIGEDRLMGLLLGSAGGEDIKDEAIYLKW